MEVLTNSTKFTFYRTMCWVISHLMIKSRPLTMIIYTVSHYQSSWYCIRKTESILPRQWVSWTCLWLNHKIFIIKNIWRYFTKFFLSSINRLTYIWYRERAHTNFIRNSFHSAKSRQILKYFCIFFLNWM
jgi:hypothetical protein